MMNFNLKDFSAIQPYNDSHVKEAIHRLLKNKPFVSFITDFFQTKNTDRYLALFKKVNTINEFQSKIVIPFVVKLLERTTQGLKIENLFLLEKHKKYLFISNHRDIILDSSLLNFALCNYGFDTTQIAIGSNLLIKPWIIDLVKLNKSFNVDRHSSMKESLFSAKLLSAYIRKLLFSTKDSVWIAQREGRTKDGNDETQQSLLKMLNMSGNKNIIDNFYQLNIVPVSISYELEPCDYFKAKELYLSHSAVGYKKTPDDDLKSMFQGLISDKARITLHFGEPLNKFLPYLNEMKNNKETMIRIAEIIDYQIQKNYFFYPNNYIAFDMVRNDDFFYKLKKYSLKEKNRFIAYMENKLDLMESKNVLKEIFLQIYANPVKNKLKLKKPDYFKKIT